MDLFRKILLCVDESENAERAVHYVGRFLQGASGYEITLLNIVDDPPEDVFKDEQDRTAFLEKKKAAAEETLETARGVLLGYGFDEGSIRTQTYVRACANMAQCILNHQETEGFGTVVVGRRGLSKSEEFLFGSISNKIIHYTRNCTVWVVN